MIEFTFTIYIPTWAFFWKVALSIVYVIANCANYEQRHIHMFFTLLAWLILPRWMVKLYRHSLMMDSTSFFEVGIMHLKTEKVLLRKEWWIWLPLYQEYITQIKGMPLILYNALLTRRVVDYHTPHLALRSLPLKLPSLIETLWTQELFAQISSESSLFDKWTER